jgi:hypothetical protein
MKLMLLHAELSKDGIMDTEENFRKSLKTSSMCGHLCPKLTTVVSIYKLGGSFGTQYSISKYDMLRLKL